MVTVEPARIRIALTGDERRGRRRAVTDVLADDRTARARAVEHGSRASQGPGLLVAQRSRANTGLLGAHGGVHERMQPVGNVEDVAIAGFPLVVKAVD